MSMEMIEIMAQQTRAALQKRKSSRALWLNAWSERLLSLKNPKKPVIYTSAYSFPMEILLGFDVIPFDFELDTVLTSVIPDGAAVLEAAENKGMWRDVCSYHRIAVGSYYKDLLPEPDLLISVSFYCDGKSKTNDILASFYSKPSALLYVPPEITSESVAYVKKQLKKIVKQIEQVTGQKMDRDRFLDAIRSSNRARSLQKEVLSSLARRPAAWGGGNLVGFSITGHLLDGMPILEEINQALIDEMNMRHEKKRLKPEDYRVYWMAWYPGYENNLFKVLKENCVSVPMCETYTVYWDEIDTNDPFEGLALRCLKNPYVGSGSRRLDVLPDIKKDFQMDGAILMATPACRHSKTTFGQIAERFADLDMSFLMLEVDCADPRGFHPEQVRTRLEGFVEVMAQKN